MINTTPSDLPTINGARGALRFIQVATAAALIGITGCKKQNSIPEFIPGESKTYVVSPSDWGNLKLQKGEKREFSIEKANDPIISRINFEITEIQKDGIKQMQIEVMPIGKNSDGSKGLPIAKFVFTGDKMFDVTYTANLKGPHHDFIGLSKFVTDAIDKISEKISTELGKGNIEIKAPGRVNVTGDNTSRKILEQAAEAERNAKLETDFNNALNGTKAE